MQDFIPWAQLVSPVGAWAYIIWSISTGRLIPRSTYDRMVLLMQNHTTDVVEDRNSWRASSEKKSEALRTLTETNELLANQVASSITHTMQALQEAGGIHVPEKKD